MHNPEENLIFYNFFYYDFLAKINSSDDTANLATKTWDSTRFENRYIGQRISLIGLELGEKSKE